MSRCASCHNEIEWAVSRNTGKAIPLDPGEPDNANLRVEGETEGGTLIVGYVTPGQGTRVTHFATCPNARAHRR